MNTPHTTPAAINAHLLESMFCSMAGRCRYCGNRMEFISFTAKYDVYECCECSYEETIERDDD